MSTKMKTNELPEFFNGEFLPNGDIVTNPFSGESIYLDPLALSVYDFIWGCVVINYTDHKDFQKCMRWFMTHYPKEYMVLLD